MRHSTLMRPRWLCVVCCVDELCGTLSLCRPMACVHLAFVLLHEDMHLLQDGWTTLMEASETENVECVELLLDRGLQVNVQKKGKFSFLV